MAASFFSRFLGALRAPTITLALGVTVLCMPATATPLANPDFEANAGGPPAGWYLSDAARARGEAVVVENGTRRLQLSPNAANTPGPDPLGVGQLIDATDLHGTRLRLEARIGAEGAAVAVVGAVLLDGAGGVVEQLVLMQADSGGDLIDQLADLDRPVPETARNLVVFASVEGVSGRAWFDSVRIDVIDSDDQAAVANGTVTASLPDAAEASQSAAITLDPALDLGAVPDLLFGMNVEWIRNANGLWNEVLGALDPDIVALSANAGITLLRFPGGAWSDAYDWRDGIGPQAMRPSRPHYPGDDETSRHAIGTDEMAEFARAIGARLLITVNAGSGTAEDAAAWAAHVRDTHGSDLVYMWQVGNELYMKGDITGGSVPPDVYARRVLEFAAAIRAEIPDARIGAIGLENFGRYRFNDYPRWNEIVLAKAGDVIDYFTVHNGYAPLVPGLGASEGERAYRAMLAAPARIAENLLTTAAQIERHVPQGGRDVALAVTEWGPWFAIDPQSPWFDHVKTLGSAMFAARTLNVLLRAPDTHVATAFKLSDWLKMGWIGLTDEGSWRATPLMSVLELYSNGLRGASLIGVAVDGPTFDTPATGFVDPVRGARVVDAVAAAHPDGRLTVLLSSADLWDTTSVAVDLGREGRWRLRATMLTGAAPDAHRGTVMIDVEGLDFAEPAPIGPRGAMRSSDADSVPLVTLDPREVEARFEVDLPAVSLLRLDLEPLP